MSFRLWLRNLIIGKENYIPSHAAFKTAILRGQICLVAIAVCLLYIFTDWLSGIDGFKIYYIIGITLSLFSFLLNRRQHYVLSNVLFLVTANCLVYIFASNDDARAGTYIYFIIISLVALAFFGYQYRWHGISFCLLSLGLFILAYVVKFKVVSISNEQAAIVYSESYIRTTFVINYIVSLIVASSIFYFLIDVSAWSEREILSKNELLTKTNKELDRFVYSASHDLKAPLSSMLGLIEIAQRTDDPEEVKACLGMMRDRIHNLDEFIREIIDYSRNSRLDVRTEKFNLLNFTKEIVDSLRYAEGFENIYFKFDIPIDLEIKTDRARLKVILNNLIGNSLKYHDANKENPLIEILAAKKGEHLSIQIKDNGLGISEEHLPKIFEMFYRASEKSKGSGLGLYIVKETLDKLSGTITVESTLSQGSQFSVIIPSGY
jgi:signal transduction histidine kinase